MNSKIIQLFGIVFLMLAVSYPIMRMSGSQDADLPAYGALIISLIMIMMIYFRMMILEKKLNELKDEILSTKNASEIKKDG